MSPDQIFSMLNLAAMAAWLLLAVLPRRPWAAETVSLDRIGVPGTSG